MTTKLKTARAVADVTSGLVLASVEIGAPIERVFKALTTDEITKWWGAPDLYQTTKFTADLRPGGKWISEGVGADGSQFAVRGEYVTVEPPTRLVCTWQPDWDGDNVTTIHYRLEKIEGGTRVTIRHEGFGDRAESCSGHADGWERVFTWLQTYCTRSM